MKTMGGLSLLTAWEPAVSPSLDRFKLHCRSFSTQGIGMEASMHPFQTRESVHELVWKGPRGSLTSRPKSGAPKPFRGQSPSVNSLFPVSPAGLGELQDVDEEGKQQGRGCSPC